MMTSVSLTLSEVLLFDMSDIEMENLALTQLTIDRDTHTMQKNITFYRNSIRNVKFVVGVERVLSEIRQHRLN
jgi:hypothetical protein